MATIDSQDIIDILLANGGIYPGDEDMPVVRIVRYINGWGARTHGVVYEHEAQRGLLHKYDRPSEHIIVPEVIFRCPPWDAE
jgi:hypothetical protein